jgi:hypothetical protein
MFASKQLCEERQTDDNHDEKYYFSVQMKVIRHCPHFSDEVYLK